MHILQQYDFYYGAILNAILSYNKDVSPALIESGEHKQVYRMLTNKSNQECLVYMKYASKKKTATEGYNSWSFSFTDAEKNRINQYYNSKLPIFLFLLCLESGLKNSKIAVIRYDEYNLIQDKSSFTLSLEKYKGHFNLFTDSKSRKDSLAIKTNRIEQKFDELIEESVKMSKGYFCPKCGSKINI